MNQTDLNNLYEIIKNKEVDLVSREMAAYQAVEYSATAETISLVAESISSLNLAIIPWKRIAKDELKKLVISGINSDSEIFKLALENFRARFDENLIRDKLDIIGLKITSKEEKISAAEDLLIAKPTKAFLNYVSNFLTSIDFSYFPWEKITETKNLLGFLDHQNRLKKNRENKSMIVKAEEELLSRGEITLNTDFYQPKKTSCYIIGKQN